jgi:L,D-transpeptidase catalytic domain
MFMVFMFLPVIHKSNDYVQHSIRHQADKRTHLRKQQVVPDIQEMELTFVQQQIQYLARLLRIKSQANILLNQFHQEVNDWGKKHQYHDPYNGVAYQLDYEYNQDEGFDQAVSDAHTMNEYEAAIKLVKANLTHLQAMASDYADKTSWDHPHASDLRLLRYYHLSGQVVVVSFIEQACRVYQNGKLVKAFLVTSGRFSDPSPVGLWHILWRRWHTVFKSRVPVGSPNWYPDTPINYAMEYHVGGYYLHDSWWRAYYGPGTNFPHYDPDGEEFAGSGSHGCINLSEGAAAWMYENTGYGTTVVTY